jgi:hypothetical protein
VAASAFATPLSADAFQDSSAVELAVELAMRSARSGSVAASASAT